MCSRDLKQSDKADETLVSNEKTKTHVSEFQDIEKPNIKQTNCITDDVLYKDETKNICCHVEAHDKFDSNRCEYNLEQNKEAQNDWSRATKVCSSKSRNTKETNNCKRHFVFETQSEPLIKKIKQCSCGSNNDAFGRQTDQETGNGCVNFHNNQYQDFMNKFQGQSTEIVCLRKLCIALAVVFIFVVASMPFMIMTFKLSEKSSYVSKNDDTVQTKSNETTMQDQLTNRTKNGSDTDVGKNEKGYSNLPINDDAYNRLIAVINQLTSKRRSVIHLKSKSQSQKTGNIRWFPRFAPQGDLIMSNDGRSIQVTTGGLYFIYSRVQFSGNANSTFMRKVTLGFTLTRTNTDGIIIDKEYVQQRCMITDGKLEHPLTIQAVMLLDGEDEVSISVPEHQQLFLSRASGKHTFGMFEL